MLFCLIILFTMNKQDETLKTNHADFVSGYKEGRLTCDISIYDVNKIALAGLLPRGYGAATNFFATIWILSLIGFIPVGYFFGWGWGVAILVIGWLLPKAIRKTNARGLLEKALEDEHFYEAMIEEGIITVRKR